MSFKDFLKDLTLFMNRGKKNINDISYVNITRAYYMTPEAFFALEEPPKLEEWKEFTRTDMGTWEFYTKFQIVMMDNSWIEYHQCEDEFYSKFIYHPALRKAGTEYIDN